MNSRNLGYAQIVTCEEKAKDQETKKGKLYDLTAFDRDDMRGAFVFTPSASQAAQSNKEEVGVHHRSRWFLPFSHQASAYAHVKMKQFLKLTLDPLFQLC